MINRITIRLPCINAICVCFGSTDQLQPSKLGEVLCHRAEFVGIQQQ